MRLFSLLFLLVSIQLVAHSDGGGIEVGFLLADAERERAKKHLKFILSDEEYLEILDIADRNFPPKIDRLVSKNDLVAASNNNKNPKKLREAAKFFSNDFEFKALDYASERFRRRDEWIIFRFRTIDGLASYDDFRDYYRLLE